MYVRGLSLFCGHLLLRACPTRVERLRHTAIVDVFLRMKAEYGVDFLRFSAGDVDTFDPAQWVSLYPEFSGSLDACTETVVSPGELLYYPTGWWHQVRAFCVSASLCAESFEGEHWGLLLTIVPFLLLLLLLCG